MALSSDYQANSDINSQLHRVSLLQRVTFETALTMTTLAFQASQPLSSVLQDLIFCWLYLSVVFMIREATQINHFLGLSPKL